MKAIDAWNHNMEGGAPRRPLDKCVLMRVNNVPKVSSCAVNNVPNRLVSAVWLWLSGYDCKHFVSWVE
jgi:hypothetical protein